MKSKSITPKLRPALEAQLAGHDNAGLMAAAYQHHRHTLGLPAKLIKQVMDIAPMVSMMTPESMKALPRIEQDVLKYFQKVMEGNTRPDYTYYTTNQNRLRSYCCSGEPGDRVRFVHYAVIKIMGRGISEGDVFSYGDGAYEGYRPIVVKLTGKKRGYIGGYALVDHDNAWIQEGGVLRMAPFEARIDAMAVAREMADTAAMEEADHQEAYEKGQGYADAVNALFDAMNAARAANEPNVSSMLKAMAVSRLDSAVLAATIACSRCSEFEPFTPAHDRKDTRVGSFMEGYESNAQHADLLPDMITVIENTCAYLRDYIDANT